MTDRELLAARYALVLALHGEGSPQEDEFLKENQSPDNTALLAEVALVARDALEGVRVGGGRRAVYGLDDLRSRVTSGVAAALARPLVRAWISSDNQATMRALADVVGRPGPVVEQFLQLWLGAIPAHY